MSVAATHASDLLTVRHETPGPATAWRRCVHGLHEPHLAHSHQWASIIHRAYGHEPLYLAADGGAGEPGLLPAFIIRRPFFGTTVSSMPFLDGGGPCGASTDVQTRLVETMIGEALRVGAGVAEIRCNRRLDIPWKPAEHKVNMILSLPPNADDLWKQLDRTVRNQVRKAQRSGMTVEFGGAEQLDTFYRIFAVRMRELGSPVHDRGFFRAMFDEFGGHARVAVVRHGATPVGALVALAFRDTLTVPWASCLRPSLTLCSNMLLYWETIRTACAEGFRRFDFGRSSRDSGTYRFKRQWGANESPLFWYTIPIDGRPRSTEPRNKEGRVAACLTSAWRHLPLAITCGVGPRIRRYLTQ